MPPADSTEVCGASTMLTTVFPPPEKTDVMTSEIFALMRNEIEATVLARTATVFAILRAKETEVVKPAATVFPTRLLATTDVVACVENEIAAPLSA